VAESIAPSILWIDEIEKALSGVQGGAGNDTLARIFGTLLTWMQEKEKPVFVIATANDISNIPPEFLRKGRFDEIFFVDFPDDKSIKEIFEIHFKKRGKSIDSIDLKKVLDELRKKLKEFKDLKDKGYSGADIESIVSEVVENAFLDGKETISTEDVIKVVKESKPIAETLKDKIKILKELCKKIDAKPAD
jgi:SpoVK/Ycf46/Vps4 family AAA+-type ATPase